jgi:ATP-dependent exoDNAse (exonuclease V) alpha subunit
MLSVLDVTMQVTGKFLGFAHGRLDGQSILDSPYILHGAAAQQAAMAADGTPTVLHRLLAHNIIHNPVVKTCLSMLEQQHPTSGLVVLGASVVDKIVRQAMRRGHAVAEMAEDCVGQLLSTFTTLAPTLQRTAQQIFSAPLMRVGQLKYRGTLDTGSLAVNPLAVLTPHELVGVEITLETALFPFLFPFGKGAFNSLMRMPDYLHMQLAKLFSLFTLYKPYLLTMYQLSQSAIYLQAAREACFDKDLHDYRRKHPGCTDAEAMLHVAKHTIPSTVKGCPAWHKRQLSNLLCLVEHHGMPHLFLTLTSDEATEMRWEPEMSALEGLLRKFNKSFTWQDAPVECAAMFHRRVTDFMNDHILGKRGGKLGRVTHHLTRYEVQGRGSLHAHIILWLHPDDVERVASEIVACVPAAFDKAKHEFVPPTDPQQLKLYELVMRKQHHRCKKTGCMANKHRRCQYHFPYPPHPSRKPTFNPLTKRWDYYRPGGGENRNVVPYHPDVLLLWEAHMNLQRITHSAWSFYVLKYALKAEPSGRLRIDAEAAQRLGLVGLSDSELSLISAMVLSKPVSPCEAALHLLRIDTVRMPPVLYVASTPPELRTRLVTGAAQRGKAKPAPVDLYCSRPPSLHEVTFTQYFKQYSTGSAPRCSVRVDGQPVQLQCVGRDTYGNFVHALPPEQPAIVRFTDYHPANQMEAYFYNVLLQHVPFQSEQELLSAANSDKSWFAECHLRDLISSQDDVEQHLHRYSARHLLERVETHRMLNLMLQKNSRANLDMHSPVTADAPAAAVAEEGAEKDLLGEFADLLDCTLTAEQQGVFDALMSSDGGLHVVSGAPGAGKTFLTRYLAMQLAMRGKQVALYATTGAAASRLSRYATTVHAGFGIPAVGTIAPLQQNDPLFMTLVDADVIIIDEFSMLSSLNLDNVMYRLQMVATHLGMTLDQLLEGKRLVLVGDHCQLGTVCRCRPDEDDGICWTCHITNSHWYGRATAYHLCCNFRAAGDPGLVRFQNLCRTQQPTQAEVDAALRRCYISEADVDAHIDSVGVENILVLCSHREDVAAYNAMLLRKMFSARSIVTVQTQDYNSGKPDWPEWTEVAAAANTLPEVAVGAPVMITSNVNLERGAVNGAMGTVTALHRGAAGLISQVEVQLLTGEHISVRRSVLTTRFHNGQKYQQCTFPLQLAFAITGHKSQGMTIEKHALIHVREAFCPGLAYVMVSRVKHRKYLRIVGGIPAEQFRPMPAHRARHAVRRSQTAVRNRRRTGAGA